MTHSDISKTSIDQKKKYIKSFANLDVGKGGIGNQKVQPYPREKVIPARGFWGINAVRHLYVRMLNLKFVTGMLILISKYYLLIQFILFGLALSIKFIPSLNNGTLGITSEFITIHLNFGRWKVPTPLQKQIVRPLQFDVGTKKGTSV